MQLSADPESAHAVPRRLHAAVPRGPPVPAPAPAADHAVGRRRRARLSVALQAAGVPADGRGTASRAAPPAPRRARADPQHRVSVEGPRAAGARGGAVLAPDDAVRARRRRHRLRPGRRHRHGVPARRADVPCPGARADRGHGPGGQRAGQHAGARGAAQPRPVPGAQHP
ncbi:hypothetical protein STCU_11725 [Strigomonas culicis]|uniref:Uncharacterized protein n=1 Tax=Strigomonas culicis TaxID=28005 RepID=S9UMA7_9TRYP|nr:hypothetical protein STCU_11725 [Strigomonas culicis]|eukprot:EPY15841.1 hypothetical protein STCU_11725 [Strigomonas culicis]